jgi:hypothetical protein
MKYLGLFVFCALLIWSWRETHSISGISYETHFSIQERMAEMIEVAIKSKKPEAIGIKITKLWTEAIDDKKVQAQFTYEYSEKSEDGETANRSVNGLALLTKVEENSEQELWSIESVKTTLDVLTFQEGIIINPMAEDAGEVEESAPINTDAPASTETPAKSE